MSTETRTASGMVAGFRQLLDERILVAERRMQHTVGEAERRRLEHLIGRDLSTHLMGLLAEQDDITSLHLDRSIGRGPHGEPLFPTGVVGSIAHSAGLVAAAVAARRTGVLSIGLDLHSVGPLPGDLTEYIGRGRELRGAPRLNSLGIAPGVLFSAKESVFKAWFSLTGNWLEFAQACVLLRDDGRFRVAEPVSPVRWRGRWAISDGIIRTSAVLAI